MKKQRFVYILILALLLPTGAGSPQAHTSAETNLPQEPAGLAVSAPPAAQMPPP